MSSLKIYGACTRSVCSTQSPDLGAIVIQELVLFPRCTCQLFTVAVSLRDIQ